MNTRLLIPKQPFRFASNFIFTFTFFCFTFITVGIRCYAMPETDSLVTMKNGLRVRIVERPSAPLVAVELWVRAGSIEEEPELEGSAHFLEHTLFKGTADEPRARPTARSKNSALYSAPQPAPTMPGSLPASVRAA